MRVAAEPVRAPARVALLRVASPAAWPVVAERVRVRVVRVAARDVAVVVPVRAPASLRVELEGLPHVAQRHSPRRHKRRPGARGLPLGRGFQAACGLDRQELRTLARPHGPPARNGQGLSTGLLLRLRSRLASIS